MRNHLGIVISCILVFGISWVGRTYSHEDFSAKQNCFNTSDGRIHYLDEGSGEVIVLLHGVPTSGWLYRKMAPELVNNGYRVIVPDMLGFGNSDHPLGDRVYSPENHAKRLVELMNHLEVEKWTQVVHEAGALWVAPILKKTPERISKLVVMNAIIDPSAVNWKEQIGTGLMAKIGLKLQKMGIKSSSFVSNYIRKNMTVSSLTKNELAGYELPILNGKTTAIFYHYSFMLDAVAKGDAGLSQADLSKTLFIWGKADNVLNWQAQSNLLQKEKHDLHLLDCGHLVPEDAPKKADSLILNFIRPK